MLIHHNIVENFYDKIILSSNNDTRVLIICALDVDSLCAAKILSELFSCDFIQYTLKPVANDEQLYHVYQKHKSEHKIVIFINCGGDLDLTEELNDHELEDDDIENHEVEIFVVDSRRPINLVNIHTSKPVSVVLKQEDEISCDFDFIPKLKDIHYDGNDDEFNHHDDPDFDFEEWQENRDKIMNKYNYYNFYSTSSAYLLFDMAYRMSKDTNELLWLAIIAIADQYHNNLIPREKYTSYMVALTAEQKRIKNANEKIVDQEKLSINILKVNDVTDLDLVMYRQWSIIESLYHSPTTFINFKLWTEKGQNKLLRFLGDMGIPLVEAKQKFHYMENEFVENFKDLFQESIEKHKISNTESIKSFIAQIGYQEEVLAQDMVWSLNSLLRSTLHAHCTDSEQLKNQCDGNFNAAYTCLTTCGSTSNFSIESLMPGFANSKTMLHAINNTVKQSIVNREIHQVGSVLFYEMQRSNPDIQHIVPFIHIFTKIMRDAFIKSLSNNKRRIAVQLPLICVIPAFYEQFYDENDPEEQNNNNNNNKTETAVQSPLQNKFLIYCCRPAEDYACKTIMPRVLTVAEDRINKIRSDDNQFYLEKVGFDPSCIVIDMKDKIELVETIGEILMEAYS